MAEFAAEDKYKTTGRPGQRLARAGLADGFIDAAWNYTDSVKILLAHRTSPGIADVYGCTALMSAATHGNAEMEEKLLQVGASIDAQDKNGNTAFMNAVKSTVGLKSVRILIQHGANVDLKNNDGETALRELRGWVLPRIVHLLKQAGAKE